MNKQTSDIKTSFDEARENIKFKTKHLDVIMAIKNSINEYAEDTIPENDPLVEMLKLMSEDISETIVFDIQDDFIITRKI